MQTWTIGIICFNEKGTIQQVYEDVDKMLTGFGVDFEIILVDDASTDGSKEIIQSISAKDPLHVKAILHEYNQGIGSSIRDVYENATKENMVFVPGDGQFDVFELMPFKTFPANNYICFFRKENETYSMFRNLLSFLNKLFNQIFLGLNLKDVNWVKAYKRQAVQSFDLKMKSSVIESEICAKLNQLNYTPQEVQSKYQQRVYGESQGASFRNMFRVAKELLKLVLIIISFRFSKKRKELEIRKV